ncbi:MAG: hypothetical protein KGL43_14345 [Burkholderiales bacterium]|nr:hypothetical protein [Burkholderiales bacterium]
MAPSVELVARPSPHPALSDLLPGAAREVHGRAGLYEKAGEFPSPIEHGFPISPDAARRYASGKSFLYRTFPFWIASLIARLAAVIVPTAIGLVPGFRFAPAVCRWRMQSRIYRWYAALQRLEHEAQSAPLDPRRCDDLLHHLDRIEANVMRISVPPAFADLLYDLRGHLVAVRERLLAQRTASARAETAPR